MPSKRPGLIAAFLVTVDETLLNYKHWEGIIPFIRNRILIILLTAAMAGAAWAPNGITTPQVINVQGRITGPSFPSKVIFKIWEVTGIEPETMIYAEEKETIGAGAPASEEILIDRTTGVFNTYLGPTGSWGGETYSMPEFLAEKDYYMWIEVDSERLDPPQKIVYVPLAITAKNQKGGIVRAKAHLVDAPAVYGNNSSTGSGVRGDSVSGYGVLGLSTGQSGVVGSSNASGKAAVYGRNDRGYGVWGARGEDNKGFLGTSNSGVYGESAAGYGVWGSSGSSNYGGVYATNTGNGPALVGESNSNTKAAIYATNIGGGPALEVSQGKIKITGTYIAPRFHSGTPTTYRTITADMLTGSLLYDGPVSANTTLVHIYNKYVTKDSMIFLTTVFDRISYIDTSNWAKYKNVAVVGSQDEGYFSILFPEPIGDDINPRVNFWVIN